MNRPIWTLPLSKHTINKLDKLGYKCCEDLLVALGNILFLFSLLSFYTSICEVMIRRTIVNKIINYYIG